MSELQKNIIEGLLKEKKKTKRELSKLLDIKENSINRLLKNSNIALTKLGVIADFLEVDIKDLLPKKNSIREPEEEYQRIDSSDVTNQMTINNLSEALNRSTKTIENLARIIAENFPDKNLR